MAITNLTDASIRKTPVPAAGRTELWDRQVLGLGVRITPGDVRSWFVRYRTPGGHRRFKLGEYPGLTLKAARLEAQRVLADVGRGGDPQRAKHVARSSDAPTTLAELVDRYVSHVRTRNRSWAETERILLRYIVPRLGKLPLEDVRRGHIEPILDELAETAPSMANAAMRQVRRLFNWCVEKDLLPASPIAKVKLPAKERSRDRVLTDDEVRSIWAALDALPYPFGPCLKLTLLTGQRRTEVAGMMWSDVDLDAETWMLPRERTKGDRAHFVPLSRQALKILEELPCRSSGLVFTTNGRTQISGFSKIKAWIDAKVGVPAWRIHDLRRTAASGMAKLGVAPHVIEKALNHSTGQISGVAGIYNRHEYADEKKQALAQWARYVSQACRDASGRTLNVAKLGVTIHAFMLGKELEILQEVAADCDVDALQSGMDSIVLKFQSRKTSRETETLRVSRKLMFAKAKAALKHVERAISALRIGRSYVDNKNVTWSHPWSEDIEAELAAQAAKLRAAIDSGGPNQGKPQDAVLHPTVLELADLYEELTRKRATTSGSEQSPPFQRFALAAIEAFGFKIERQVVVRAMRKRPRNAK